MEVKNQRVGLRLKSGKSFEPLSGKASFKIKATSYTAEGRLFGLKGADPQQTWCKTRGMMHETLAYRLFRAYGIAAPRSGYAWVTLNGADVGLELVLEPYDDQFDLEHFASTKHLYEGVADLCAQGAESFEIEDGATDERSDLDALIAAATAEVTGTGETWLSVLGLVADINEMADFWAIEHFIGHTDGYSLAANNYFLHSTAGEVFTLHPWGTDRCFVETAELRPLHERLVCDVLGGGFLPGALSAGAKHLAGGACAARFSEPDRRDTKRVGGVHRRGYAQTLRHKRTSRRQGGHQDLPKRTFAERGGTLAFSAGIRSGPDGTSASLARRVWRRAASRTLRSRRVAATSSLLALFRRGRQNPPRRIRRGPGDPHRGGGFAAPPVSRISAPALGSLAASAEGFALGLRRAWRGLLGSAPGAFSLCGFFRQPGPAHFRIDAHAYPP